MASDPLTQAQIDAMVADAEVIPNLVAAFLAEMEAKR